MATEAKVPVMVGTALGGQGGVAAVTDVHREHGLFDRYGVHYVASHREGGALLKLWCGLRAFVELLWLLIRGRVALVHAHVASHGSFKRKAAYLALARAFGVPTIFHLHGGGFREFVEQQASPRLRLWIQQTIRCSTAVVALSESWATYLRGLAPDADVRVIANPVFMPEQADCAMEEPGRVLFLGKASQAKGVFDLLHAIALVAKHRPDVHLAIGGDGDLEKVRACAAELGLSERVELLGWVSGPTKIQELVRAQVFVLPSYNEGLPMAMLEAMAYGKAVVVSSVGGIPEAVQHDEQGLLVKPGAVEELAAVLATLLTNAEQRRRLGMAARLRVKERFSTEHVLGQMGALYEELGVKPRQGESAREQC